MTLYTIPYPAIDPVLIEFGPLVIRWYALAYVAGLLLGWGHIRHLVTRSPNAMTPEQVDDFLAWAALGAIVGGRVGYVLFYNPLHYAEHPMQIPAVWQGGMAFHGGLLGIAAAIWLFTRRWSLRVSAVADVVACAAPIGLFFGRIANFINGELYGRPTDVAWAMVFPRGGPVPRHPSQLYEAVLEGLVLFLVLYGLWRIKGVRERPGILLGTFLGGYGVMRSIAELFRQPDAHLGYFWGGLTMGQLLSFPMILAGVAIVVWAARRPVVAS